MKKLFLLGLFFSLQTWGAEPTMRDVNSVQNCEEAPVMRDSSCGNCNAQAGELGARECTSTNRQGVVVSAWSEICHI